MTMRLDIVTNDAGELVRREHARELGAGVVVALYRLVKVAQMHDLGNQAFLRQLEQTHQSIGEYCLRSGSNVSVLFAHKATFVAGQLLKGNRGAYEAATELGALLERIGGSELHVAREITREELHSFAEQISLHYRTGSPVRLPPKMQLRRVADAARLRGIELEDLTPDQRLVRAYASAVVIMRRFFEDLAASRYVLPRRIKRIAQSLVDLSDVSSASYLGVTEVRNANHDEAGRAVNTAILAVAIARETTQNRTVLAQIAMAALMHDVARPRALALAAAGGAPLPGMAGPTTLSEDQEDRLAAGAAAVLTALGRVNEPTITRTVLTFEALWLRRRTWLGPVYWGARSPTFHASIIAIARRYNDLLTPEPGLPPPTTDYAVATLANELTEGQDRMVLRMLVSALGLLPTGTLVQLSTGEVAEVTRGTRRFGEKPAVRIVADPNGQPYPQPVDVDLAQDLRRLVHSVLAVDGWRNGLADAPDSDMETAAPSGPPVAAPAARVAPPPVAAAPPPPAPAPPAPAPASAAPVGAKSSGAQAMNRMIRESLHPEPTARGNLAATPFPHVLVYMLEHTLTGTVVFDTREPREQDDAIYFVDGVPAKMRVADGSVRLGEVLVTSGALEAVLVEHAAESALKTGARLGEHLVSTDILSQEALAWALEQQLLQRMARFANLPATAEYAFYANVDLIEHAAGEIVVTHPLSPVLAAVRQWADRARIDATLARMAAQPLVLHPESEPSGLRLTSEEEAILDVLQAESVVLADLHARRVASADAAASLVYVLAVTRQLAFAAQKKPPMAPRSARAAAPAPAPPAPVAAPAGPSGPPRPPAPSTPRAIPARGATARHAPQIRPIGAKRSTTQPVAGARSSIAPGSLPAPARSAPPPVEDELPPDSADGKTIAQPPGAFAAMIAARAAAGRASLTTEEPPAMGKATGAASPPTAVKKTVRGLAPALDDERMVTDVGQGPLDLDEQVQTAQNRPALPSLVDVEPDEELALRAMGSFRLAEVALQRGDLAGAERHARSAQEADPSEPDYAVLLAWVRSQLEPATTDEAIRTLSDAIIERPAHESALLYRGKLLARSGRVREALADLDEVLSTNPHHREALEEARQLRAKKA